MCGEGGIVVFSRNYPAYHRWCLTGHAREGYVETTFKVTGMTALQITAGPPWPFVSRRYFRAGERRVTLNFGRLNLTI